MDFRDVIVKRESVRNYDPSKSVPVEILNRILEAGRIAPSAANRQPWEFWIIRSAEMLNKVRTGYNRSWFADAPLILVVVGNRDNSWVRDADKYNSLETDLTIAMDHMILAAANEGVGTCWIANFDPVILRSALNLTPGQVVFAITPLGYPRTDYVSPPRRPRKSLEHVVVFK